jgi:molecular chaperone DnaJ/curved DNA-binding protein
MTARDIQKAYRELVKQYHPDRVGPQGTAPLQEIVEAYRVLSDPERRQAYHQQLLHDEAAERVMPEPIVGRYGPPPEPLIPEPFSGRQQSRPEPLVPELRSILHDFLTIRPSLEALGARLRRNFTGVGVPKSERLEALNVEVCLSLEEAMYGGVVRLGVPVFSPCRLCRGTGRDWWPVCLACMGQGTGEREEVVAVRIPPGVRPGTILEVPLHGLGIHNVYLRLHVSVTART